MEYRIFEGNMERLEKKLQRIANKCKKYGNDFIYEKIGEEFAEHTIVCDLKFVTFENFGLLASVFPRKYLYMENKWWNSRWNKNDYCHCKSTQ